MTQSKIILLAVLGVLLVVSAAGVVASGALGGSHHSGHHSGQGWRGHGHGGNPCARLTRHSSRVAEVLIEEHLDLNDAQLDQLQPVLAVVDAWRTDLAVSCESGRSAADVPSALVALEDALTRSAQAVRELRPAYDTFYAALNAEQQAHISQAMARHGGNGGEG